MVAVGVQDLVDAPHVLANALMAQVGGRVDEKRLLALDHGPAISAPRARVRPRLFARGTVAEKRGHAAACARAHKGECVLFHKGLFLVAPYAADYTPLAMQSCPIRGRKYRSNP